MMQSIRFFLCILVSVVLLVGCGTEEPNLSEPSAEGGKKGEQRPDLAWEEEGGGSGGGGGNPYEEPSYIWDDPTINVDDNIDIVAGHEAILEAIDAQYDFSTRAPISVEAAIELSKNAINSVLAGYGARGLTYHEVEYLMYGNFKIMEQAGVDFGNPQDGDEYKLLIWARTKNMITEDEYTALVQLVSNVDSETSSGLTPISVAGGPETQPVRNFRRLLVGSLEYWQSEYQEFEDPAFYPTGPQGEGGLSKDILVGVADALWGLIAGVLTTGTTLNPYVGLLIGTAASGLGSAYTGMMYNNGDSWNSEDGCDCFEADFWPDVG